MESNSIPNQNQTQSSPKPESKKRKHIFDRGLDFELTYRKLVRLLFQESDVRRCYIAIALLQLRNGLRSIEAVRAFKQYLSTKQIEFEIPVAKKKQPVYRLVVIPYEFAAVNLDSCSDLLSVSDEVLVNRYRVWLHKYLKINSHSLRYAFITYLLKMGVNPTIVAKIVKFSKLDGVLHYTQSKVAEEILRHLM